MRVRTRVSSFPMKPKYITVRHYEPVLDTDTARLPTHTYAARGIRRPARSYGLDAV